MLVQCPICQDLITWEENPNRPFCSDRCKWIDLGAWASEGYLIQEKTDDRMEQPNS